MQNIEELKSKLIEHINKIYPIEQAEEFISHINAMNDDELIEFLKQQGLVKSESEPQDCVFCSMIKGEIPTTKIAENEAGIAILEINPISKGHTLIIPKTHVNSKEKLPKEIEKLTDEVYKKINSNLKPKKIELISGNIMGHEIINVLPVYEGENMNSPREKKTAEDLKKLKEEIEKEIIEKKIEVVKEEKKEINEKNTWLPKRFP